MCPCSIHGLSSDTTALITSDRGSNAGGVHLSGLAWKKVPAVATNTDPEIPVDTYSVPVPKVRRPRPAAAHGMAHSRTWPTAAHGTAYSRTWPTAAHGLQLHMAYSCTWHDLQLRAPYGESLPQLHALTIPGRPSSSAGPLLPGALQRLDGPVSHGLQLQSL